MAYKDIAKKRAYNARYRVKNRDKLRADHAKYHAKNRAKLNACQNEYRKIVRDEIRTLKETHLCADCGRRYPYFVMDYDHVRGEKLFNISWAMGKSTSRRKIKDEIAKCDLVCSNCHRYRTWA